MIYKKYKELSLSALGLGLMRLPVVEGDNAKIDEEKTAEMVEYAISHGVNYFDTAWGYHSGQSEPTIGKILSKYPRESFYLASKFPGYDTANLQKVDEIFNRQLERCRVDYFDFYLVHNVCESNIDAYLDESYGLYEYLKEQKKQGRIKNLGFSVHGTLETTKRFLEKYGDAMEFCQIQLNWIDWHFQNAKAKVELMDSLGIPVWVMEPVRGGKLAKLSEKHMAALEELRPGVGAPEWAFRYLQSIPQVTVTLSGMSNMDQLAENVKTFSEEKPLDENEINALYKIASEMVASVPCTACRYCTEKCPMGLDIPRLIELYNEHVFTGGGFIAPMALSAISEDKRPSSCVGCRGCEAVCPQSIKISEVMADFAKRLN
ncbi:MAG: aldo/keto reductase [Clostridia bacterium]|nr:aldo/keto reductase [Clostridia bacterium]